MARGGATDGRWIRRLSQALCALVFAFVWTCAPSRHPLPNSALTLTVAHADDLQSPDRQGLPGNSELNDLGLDKEQQEELRRALKEREAGDDNTHQKEEPTATPTPTTTPEAEKEEEEEQPQESEQQRLARLGQEIIDSDNFKELVEGLPPDTARKFLQAQKEMIDGGYGDVNMRKDLTHTAELVKGLQTKRDALIDAVRRGEMSEADYLQTLKMDRLALYKQAVGGAALDKNRYGTDFDYGNPLKQTRNDNDGTYWLNDARRRFQSYLNTTSDILDPNKPLAAGLQGSAMTRSRIAHEFSLLVADHTAAAQGPWGSCWTCAAVQTAIAWAPDDYANMVQQVIRNGTFLSPYTGESIKFPSDVLTPSRSNLAFNINQADGGEQQYAARIGQYVVGIGAGNNEPWDGGVAERAGAGLKAITGVENVPWIEMRRGNNFHIPTNQLGGLEGLVDQINLGTVRTAQYIPFPGHSAENSGFLLSNDKGQFVGFGVNDNSWGQRNENAFLATKGNIDKFKFPGGGGTRFGENLGGGTMASIGALNSLVRNMNQQQAMQGALAQQQAAQQQAAQQQQIAQNKKQQEDSYNKLSNKEKRMLRVYCVRNTKPSAGIPTACRMAITDKGLGAYIAGEKFDLPLPSPNQTDLSAVPQAALQTVPRGGALAGF
jgi:hypothetical protein